MAIYYTLVHKSHHCPMWNIDLMVAGKYRFFDEENPYIGKYASCTCPILENLKLPIHKQNKEYGLYRFCKMHTECLRSIEFKPIVDFEKEGYVQ